ncbi:hypothetical protein HYPSUDRAFT_144160, partial [Hypholoma sublateritium FD-334 SS-4]
GRVANEWHFEIRFVPFEQIIGYVLVLMQPQSELMYIKRIPSGLANGESGMSFFPESAEEAAPHIVRGILHAFVNHLDVKGSSSASFAPFILQTQEEPMVAAVGKEFKRLGVHTNLHNIAISSESVYMNAQVKWSFRFELMKRAFGFSEEESMIIKTPWAVTFSTLLITDPAQRPGISIDHFPDEGMRQCIHYISEWNRAEASLSLEDRLPDANKEMKKAYALLEQKPEAVVKANADGGDDLEALDYGVRLRSGFGCARNRRLARKYLIQAALSPTLDDRRKATAHAVLTSWYSNVHETIVPSRYVIAAGYHANTSAKISRKMATPDRMPAAPAVIWYMHSMFEAYSPKDLYPQLTLFVKDGIWAQAERDRQIQDTRNKMAQKTLQVSLRYCCAAPGCSIEANSGKMLLQCAGKCDRDKKPSYCSKKCQKADWKNHKPYCLPGAACSVIDDGHEQSRRLLESGPSAPPGAISVPVRNQDGSTTYISSSTIEPEFLKQMAEVVGEHRLESTQCEFHPLDF